MTNIEPIVEPVVEVVVLQPETAELNKKGKPKRKNRAQAIGKMKKDEAAPLEHTEEDRALRREGRLLRRQRRLNRFSQTAKRRNREGRGE